MELFHKYQGRSLQFALEVLALLSARERVTREELDGLARRLGLDYSGQVLRPMEAAGMLRLDQDGCRRRDRNTRAPLSLCRVEEEFLSFLLSRPEAACFLTPETAEKLRHQLVEREENLESIQRLRPKNRLDPLPQQENLAAILQAIRQGRMMEYTYQTRADPRLRQAVTLPWKVEYGAFDRRWWVIFYDPAARRTIKARLDNLSGLRLGAAVDISPEEIEEAMETLLEPEPVVLGVSPNRGALERCFLAFEDQLFVEIAQEGRERFLLRFRWYRFDRSVILRRLLSLGPGVTLLGPEPLRRELLGLLEQALEPETAPAICGI